MANYEYGKYDGVNSKKYVLACFQAPANRFGDSLYLEPGHKKVQANRGKSDQAKEKGPHKGLKCKLPNRRPPRIGIMFELGKGRVFTWRLDLGRLGCGKLACLSSD